MLIMKPSARSDTYSQTGHPAKLVLTHSEWHQGYGSCPFNGHCHLSLMRGTISRYSPWHNFASFGSVILKDLRLFVVDLYFRIRAKPAELSPVEKLLLGSGRSCCTSSRFTHGYSFSDAVSGVFDGSGDCGSSTFSIFAAISFSNA